MPQFLKSLGDGADLIEDVKFVEACIVRDVLMKNNDFQMVLLILSEADSTIICSNCL